MDNMRETIIKLDNVSYNIAGHIILDNLTDEIYKGETIFLTGKSGGGKTTTLKVIAGLIYPQKGEVIIRNVKITKATNREIMELHIQNGFVFQDNALISNMTIYENIELALRYHDEKNLDFIHNKVMELLNQMDLTDDKDNRPAALSSGEQKLAAIARAIINNPSLLYMDEPFANLDVKSQNKVVEIITKLKQENITLIIVSHNIDFIKELADRVWIMERGKIKKKFKLKTDISALDGIINMELSKNAKTFWAVPPILKPFIPRTGIIVINVYDIINKNKYHKQPKEVMKIPDINI